jgi:hypothetical protein
VRGIASPRIFGIASLALLGLAVCGSARATPPPVLRIVATDDGFRMPRRIPAGLTQVRLVNHGHINHEGVLVHFLAPGSAAAYADSFRSGVDFPANAEDIGGPGIALPGDSTSVWLPLAPGHYAVLCFYAGHIKHGGGCDFEAVAHESHNSHATPPTADIEIHMANFRYDVHGKWAAGRHVVHLVNDGPEPHEFDPYRLPPGKHPQDYFRWMETGRKGAAPAIPLGGSGSFVKGREVWMPLTLTPGRYFMFCEVPSKKMGKDHYQLGMFEEFTVPNPER